MHYSHCVFNIVGLGSCSLNKANVSASVLLIFDCDIVLVWHNDADIQLQPAQKTSDKF